MKSVIKEVTTIWAGRAWIHAKYLNKARNNHVPLVIKYKGAKMTVQEKDFEERFDRDKMIKDMYKSGVMHKQYGIVWKIE